MPIGQSGSLTVVVLRVNFYDGYACISQDESAMRV